MINTRGYRVTPGARTHKTKQRESKKPLHHHFNPLITKQKIPSLTPTSFTLCVLPVYHWDPKLWLPVHFLAGAGIFQGVVAKMSSRDVFDDKPRIFVGKPPDTFRTRRYKLLSVRAQRNFLTQRSHVQLPSPLPHRLGRLA